MCDAEQAELRAEVERLRAQIEAGGGATQHWRAEAYRMGARVEVAEAKLADPWGLEGNAAAKAWRKKADAAEAELRALREGTLRVERYAQAQAVTAHARGSESERDWLDVIALLAPSPAATTGEADDPEHKPHPFTGGRMGSVVPSGHAGKTWEHCPTPVSSGEADALIPEPSAEEAAWQQSAISARARGDFAAERSFLDRLALAERRPAPVVAPNAEGSGS